MQHRVVSALVIIGFVALLAMATLTLLHVRLPRGMDVRPTSAPTVESFQADNGLGMGRRRRYTDREESICCVRLHAGMILLEEKVRRHRMSKDLSRPHDLTKRTEW